MDIVQHIHLLLPQHPDTGVLHDLAVAVSKQQTLEIYDPVRLEPNRLVLVWDPHSEFRYKYSLKVLKRLVNVIMNYS